MEVDCAGTSSARRRRERRLRSWLRHERMTVAMELAAATHHSSPKGGWPDTTHDALRGQKTASSAGVHLAGVLKEPEVHWEAATVGHVAAPGPLLAVPVLAGGDGVDRTALSFLVRRAVEDRKKEKEEKEKEKARKKKEAQEKADLELAKRDPWWAQHLADMKAMEQGRYKHPSSASSSKRKRKKRRKRRTPRTSSLPGRARRRQRQWFACSAGFTGNDVPRVMIPSDVVWPKMLRIMAGMVQKDSCSGMARLFLLMTVHFVLCFLPSLQARDARHHGRYGPEGLDFWFFSMLLALCSLLCLKAQDARLHGRHGPQDSLELTVHFLDKVLYMPVVVLRVVYRSRQCSIGGSAVAVHQGRFPVDTQRQLPMVLAVQMTISFSQYSAQCLVRHWIHVVFTAPVAELNVVSFTVPLNGWTIAATATVVISCSSSADMCCESVCVAMSCGVVLLLVVLTILFGTV